jgi:hypothetical protein
MIIQLETLHISIHPAQVQLEFVSVTITTFNTLICTSTVTITGTGINLRALSQPVVVWLHGVKPISHNHNSIGVKLIKRVKLARGGAQVEFQLDACGETLSFGGREASSEVTRTHGDLVRRCRSFVAVYLDILEGHGLAPGWIGSPESQGHGLSYMCRGA